MLKKIAEGEAPEALILRHYGLLWHSILLAARQVIGRQITTQAFVIDNAAQRIGFNADEIAALQQLQTLRDKVAHERNIEVSTIEAVRYGLVAEQLRRRAKELARLHEQRDDPDETEAS